MDMQIVRRGTPPPPPPWGDDIPYYWEGDEFVATTGGWQIGFSGNKTSGQKQNDRLYGQANEDTSVENRSISWVTANTVNLTNINTLRFKVTGYANQQDREQWLDFFFGISLNRDTRRDMTAETRVTGVAFDSQVYELDVSAITGNYYLKLTNQPTAISSYPGLYQLEIFEVWGEE